MMAHAMETGEYDEMREMFGDKCVDGLFEAGIFDFGFGDYGCECGECYRRMDEKEVRLWEEQRFEVVPCLHESRSANYLHSVLVRVIFRS